MSINEITAKIESLKEWEALAAEAAEQVESIKDELKQFIQQQGVEEYEAGTHIIRWTTVLRYMDEDLALFPCWSSGARPPLARPSLVRGLV